MDFPDKLKGARTNGLCLVVLGMAATACAPQLRVPAIVPAEVNLGRATKLRLLEGSGRQDARVALIDELVRQVEDGGHYAIAKPPSDEVKVWRVGGVTALHHKGVRLGPQDLGMQLDEVDWGYFLDGGRGTGRTTMRVSVFRHDGTLLVTERRYEGKAHDSGDSVRSTALLHDAVKDAVEQLVQDITPKKVTRRLRLDAEDARLRPYVKQARQGDLVAAANGLRKFLRQHPDSAPAMYNLAVLMDATGEYEIALGLYERALELEPKRFYTESRDACAMWLGRLTPLPK